MKTKQIFTLALSALTVAASLTGCKRSVTPSGDTNTGSSEEPETVVLSGVSQKDEFVEFLANKAIPSDQPAGFINRTKGYQVGDDNPFNVKPVLTVLDAETFLPVSESNWEHPFDISATMDGGMTKVDDTYMKVIDARNADIKFESAAIGHTFEIFVVPTHIDSSKVESYTKKFTVEVVDGYNVYNAKELGYFDTRHGDAEPDADKLNGDVAGLVLHWDDFKTANGLDATLEPAALLLHKDIKVTAADVPAGLFYTQAQADELGDSKSGGSLKDRTNIYTHSADKPITINGNYFGLDFSEIPLVTRGEGKTTAVGSVVTHAAVFKIDSNASTFTNLNITGNSPKAVSNEDNAKSGGLILIKSGSAATSIASDNFVARGVNITFMSELPSGDNPMATFTIADTKCFDNYNFVIYAWGATVTATNSYFGACGGPILMQDHKVWEGQNFDDYYGLVVNGYVSYTRFVDCTFENYVAGSEAWFIQFNAAPLMGTIKAMSDLYALANVGKVFVTDENHNAALYKTLNEQNKSSLFNFIALNKNADMEGMTNTPVCGNVTIEYTEGNNSVFNYRQPNPSEPLCAAYVAWQTAAAEEQAAKQQEMVMLAIQMGVCEMTDDEATMASKIADYIQTKVFDHVAIRTVNENGGPVIDLGGDLPLATMASMSATNLSSVASVATGSPDVYTLTAEQKAAVSDFTALYYNGMMMVFGLKSINLG